MSHGLSCHCPQSHGDSAGASSSPTGAAWRRAAAPGALRVAEDHAPVVKPADKLVSTDVKKQLSDATGNSIENVEWSADKNEERTKRFKEWRMV